MGSYVPSTREERRQMLEALGLRSEAELYRDVPEQMLLTGPLDLPAGKSELEVRADMETLAAQNTRFSAILRGAGAYDHYIPAIVKYIPAKEEFLTAYTPYQAELSQGILQSIFEYQTMICQLTGMEAANASVYDGAAAAAEAAAMCRDRKRTVTLISGAVHPDVINTVRTYCYGTGHALRVVPVENGKTDVEALRELLTEEVSAYIGQQPNFFGLLEDAKAIGALVHEAKAQYILSCNPISLDFYLSSYLGYLIGKNHNSSYVVVSQDTGYDAVIEYWQNEGYDVKRINTKPDTPKKTVRKTSEKTKAKKAAPKTEEKADSEVRVIKKDTSKEKAKKETKAVETKKETTVKKTNKKKETPKQKPVETKPKDVSVDEAGKLLEELLKETKEIDVNEVKKYLDKVPKEKQSDKNYIYRGLVRKFKSEKGLATYTAIKKDLDKYYELSEKSS